MEIYKTPIGILVIEKGKVKDNILFRKDPKAIAKKLSAECAEEKLLKTKYPKATEGKERLDIAGLAQQLGFCKRTEFSKVLSGINSQMSKVGVKEGFGKDSQIINAVRAQRLLEDHINTMSEVMREWYSINFPELNDLLKENLDYALVVSKIGSKEQITEEKLKEVLEDKRYAKAIPGVAKESMGSDIDENDLKISQDYAKLIISCDKQNKNLRRYIETSMIAFAPNVAEVASPYVGGILLEEAGSLEKLARLPASTIQVLGAQKAMFRFLKTHKLPPKYGILYIHPLVSQCPKTQKGKVARSIASKISIAAKVDFYGGEYIGDRLKEELGKRVKNLKNSD